MQIICPHCGFEKDTSKTVIPAHATTATCPKCKEKFTFRSFDTPKEEIAENYINNEEQKIEEVQEKRSLEEIKKIDNSKLTEEELIQKAHSAYKEQLELGQKQQEKVQVYVVVPWESPDTSINIVNKFLQTITRVLFSAPAFFATMNRPFPIAKSLSFYVFIGVLEFVSRMFFLKSALSVPADTSIVPQELIAAITSPDVFLLGLIMAPPILLLRLIVYAGLLTLVLKVVDPQRADFYLILRMFAYASAPTILCIIPALGDLIAFPWIVFNVFIFCRYGLQVSLTSSEGSYASKILFCVIAFVVFVMGMALFSTSILNSIAI